MSVSTVVITKNEARNIKRCLESVTSFSDEIILVDDYSTDETIEIARAFSNIKIHSRRFDNYINQKNYANSLATSDYIFSIDADEWCSDELQEFVQSGLKMPFIYSFTRANIYFGKIIKHGIRGYESKIRCWPRDAAKWAGSLPHEHVEILNNNEVIFEDKILYHLAHYSRLQALDKSVYYARLAAVELSKKSYVSLTASLIFNPVIKFIKDVFIKGGILDGLNGLYLGFVSFVETSVKYFEAIRIKMFLKTE